MGNLHRPMINFVILASVKVPPTQGDHFAPIFNSDCGSRKAVPPIQRLRLALGSKQPSGEPFACSSVPCLAISAEVIVVRSVP